MNRGVRKSLGGSQFANIQPDVETDFRFDTLHARDIAEQLVGHLNPGLEILPQVLHESGILQHSDAGTDTPPMR